MVGGRFLKTKNLIEFHLRNNPLHVKFKLLFFHSFRAALALVIIEL